MQARSGPVSRAGSPNPMQQTPPTAPMDSPFPALPQKTMPATQSSASDANDDLRGLREFLRRKTGRVPALNPVRCQGDVLEVIGLLVESHGPLAAVGDICDIEAAARRASAHPGRRLPRRANPVDAARRNRAGCSPAARSSCAATPTTPPSAPACWAGSSTASAIRSTAKGRWPVTSSTRSTATRPARCSAKRSPSRWRPASASSTRC